MNHRLGDLARQVGAELHGDPACEISHVDTIQDASTGALCFLTNKKYRKHLPETGASAVVLGEEYLEQCPVNALVSDNPYLTYARIASLLNPRAEMKRGKHLSAIVSDQAQVDEQAWIGPCAVVEAGTTISAGAFIGPGCVIGRDCKIGPDSHLVANITLCHGTEIGSRVLIHPGAVLGSDGFGLANDQGVWEKVPQLGNVRLGDDVEVGANTTIDRGALRDTVIENGVKLDNQIQIAHNVRIGEHTAIAACTGIAGSTSVGSSCTLGGGVGVVGHLEIGNNVHFSAQTLVTRSFKEPGFYSGNLPAVPNVDWRRTVAQIRRLDEVVKRLKRLEKKLKTDD